MKKIKLYFLILLVPLLLMGCIEKGVSTATTTPVDTTNPYSFAELTAMINGSQLATSSISYNLIDLAGWKSQVSASYPSGATYISNMITYLNSGVYTPIMSSNSSFNYTTSVNKVATLDSDIIGALGIYSYAQLKQILSELKLLNLADTTGLTLINSLNVTLNTIDTIKAINPFYSISYLLYTEYFSYFKNKTYTDYLSSINFDINTALFRLTNIKASLEILKAEITALKANTLLITTRASVLGNLEQLKETYEKYITGTETISYVNNIRSLVYTMESNEFGNTGVSGQVYADTIETVRTKLIALTNLTPDLSTKRKNLVDEINAYKERNTEYANNYSSNSDYFSIHSKVTNVVVEYQKLKDVEQVIEVQLGLGDVLPQ